MFGRQAVVKYIENEGDPEVLLDVRGQGAQSLGSRCEHVTPFSFRELEEALKRRVHATGTDCQQPCSRYGPPNWEERWCPWLDHASRRSAADAARSTRSVGRRLR